MAWETLDWVSSALCAVSQGLENAFHAAPMVPLKPPATCFSWFLRCPTWTRPVQGSCFTTKVSDNSCQANPWRGLRLCSIHQSNSRFTRGRLKGAWCSLDSGASGDAKSWSKGRKDQSQSFRAQYWGWHETLHELLLAIPPSGTYLVSWSWRPFPLICYCSWYLQTLPPEPSKCCGP